MVLPQIPQLTRTKCEIQINAHLQYGEGIRSGVNHIASGGKIRMVHHSNTGHLSIARREALVRSQGTKCLQGRDSGQGIHRAGD